MRRSDHRQELIDSIPANKRQPDLIPRLRQDRRSRIPGQALYRRRSTI